MPIVIKFKAQVELKEMKEGALITIATSYENVHKERGTTKLRKRRELKEMKRGHQLPSIIALKVVREKEEQQNLKR